MNSDEKLALLQQAIGYKYYGGSHFQEVIHPESAWRLTPFMVIVCPIRGNYFSSIDGEGKVTVTPGEILLLPRGIRHTVAMPNGGILHHAHVQFSFFDSTDFMSFFTVPKLVPMGPAAKDIAETVCNLHQEMERSSTRQEDIVQAIRRQTLLGQLLERIATVSTLTDSSSERLLLLSRLAPSLRYLDEHSMEMLCRHDLAMTAGLSDTRFHYVFKNATGYSPMAYLKNVRLRKAQALLISTDLQISEIGNRVGYPDIFHFSRLFKNAFHKSPSEYRLDLRRTSI